MVTIDAETELAMKDADLAMKDVKDKFHPFLKDYPTYEARLNAMLTWISPDPKIALLLFMQKGEDYSFWSRGSDDGILEGVGLYLDLSPKEMAVTDGALKSYVMGNCDEREGSLVRTGAIKYDGTSARLTAIGNSFARPIAARGLRTSAILEEQQSHYRSLLRMLRIAGSEDGYTLRLAVFEIIEFLVSEWERKRKQDANAPAPMYSRKAIAEALGIKLESNEGGTLNTALLCLGEAGIVPYSSVCREGTVRRGLSTYSLNGKSLLERTPQEILDQIQKISPDYTASGVLKRVLNYMQTHPDDCFSRISLNEAAEVAVSSAGEVLGHLKDLGYIERDAKGATPTETTEKVWKILLEPVGYAALCMDPKGIRDFRKCLREYEEKPNLRTEHLVTMMDNYSAERTNRGRDGAIEVETALMSIPADEPMKLVDITHYVNERLEGRRTMTGNGIANALKRLAKQGHFIRPEPGFYTRAAPV